MNDLSTDRENPTLTQLQNVSAMAELIERLENRPSHLPGIGVFYGFSGLGKTCAAIYATNRYNALYIEMGSSWTRKTLCEAILGEMSILPKRTVADQVAQIAQALTITPRPVIIDEADVLLTRGLIELAREIHDKAAASLILVGEELFPARLEAHERIHNRVLDWTAAAPASLDDTATLARLFCAQVNITDDLLKAVHHASGGRVRRVCVNIDRIREFAMTHGHRKVDATLWDDRPLWTGRSPVARRFAK